MKAKDILKFAVAYQYLIKTANESIGAEPSASSAINSAIDAVKNILNPSGATTSSAPASVKPAKEDNISEQEELGYSDGGGLIADPKTPKEQKMQKVQQQGKKIGKVSWQLGNEFVLGKRYRTTAFTPTVVLRKVVDMHSASAKAQVVDIIIDLIKTDDYFAKLRNSPESIINFISNIMGMKKIEGSSSNYNFGNIQVGYSAIPNEYWNTVFLMGDHNYSPGGDVPYIELWRSYDNLQNGVKDWIYFMKKNGFLNSAMADAKTFYEGLRNGGYFGKSYMKYKVEKHEKDYVGGINAGRKADEQLIRKKVLENL